MRDARTSCLSLSRLRQTLTTHVRGIGGLVFFRRAFVLPFCGIFGILGALPVGAQSQADIQRSTDESNRLLQQQQQRERLERERLEERRRTPSGTKPQLESAPPSPTDAPCVKITHIELDGASLLNQTQRNRLVAPYLGRCMGLQDINQLLSEITNHYISRGYVTTRAFVPPQDSSKGTLRILVLEGVVEKLELDESARDTLALSTAFPGVQGQVLNLRDLEQGIDQVNRLQSNSATIDIASGSQPGSSRVVIRNAPKKTWQPGVAVDNTGQESTGEIQGAVNLGVDHLLGFNDYLNLSVRQNLDGDSDTELSRNLSVLYSVPHGYWTTTFNFSDFDYRSLVQGQVFPFLTSGETLTTGIKVDRVVYRDQRRKWLLGGGVTTKRSRNFIEGSLVTVSSRTLSVLKLDSSYTFTALGGLWSTDAGFERGLKAFGALDDPDDIDARSPRAQFTKLSYGVSVLRPFKFGNVDLALQSSVSGQYARDVLYGSEQISIGGPFSVRGFRITSISGDTGLYWRNELSTPFAIRMLPANTRIRPYVGYDVGHVSDKYGIAGGSLSGITLGLRTLFDSGSLELAWSRPLAVPAAIDRNDHYFYFRIAFAI